MIRYDWNILKIYSTKNIINVLLTLGSRDHRASKKILQILDRFGERDSFLIKPYNLVKLNKHTDIEILQYLHMASFRSYELYKETGNFTLPTNYLSDEMLMEVSANTAVKIDKDRIIFKYEE
jgi:hypothetical protein